MMVILTLVALITPTTNNNDNNAAYIYIYICESGLQRVIFIEGMRW